MPGQANTTSVWTLQRLVRIFGETLAWAWFILAGCGGFGLILTEGPLPLTHGWYAMLSGIALCPALAWVLKRYAGIEIGFLARVIIAALIIGVGRLALVFGAWPLGPH